MRARRVVGPPCAPRQALESTSATPEPRDALPLAAGGSIRLPNSCKKSTQRAGPTVLSIRPCTSSPAQPSAGARPSPSLVVPPAPAARAPKKAITCSRVCNESVSHGHTVVVSERRQLGHQGFKRLSPRLRRRVHAAPVWALRRVSAPYQQHGAGTPCARPPHSASSPAHGGTAGLHRRCGSSGLRAAL